MSSYCYEAVDAGGLKTQGTLEVADQSEALRRIKEMGLFPTRVSENQRRARPFFSAPALAGTRKKSAFDVALFGSRVKPVALSVFTRQLATLVDAGMPLLRSLRTLQE